ncbi:recombinase family protein [Pseudomonas sp. 43(2021)]|uniref:recombinase family protein n=1 Tax=Pseudomonas sp. 43(2021) TaxID=2813560 RepID=UPI001A9FA0F6|nr:recombinase family protein [Pseudomonas sp. 43(2021)]
MSTHLYLRASTRDQDANRAKNSLLEFARQKNLSVVAVYSENISGTQLERPELNRLLECAKQSDILLVESVDRLSRLSINDWEKLKHTIKLKGLRLVIADLPTSHEMFGQGITGEVMQVINSMLIDLMATMARLDQQKRVERIREGLINKRINDPTWSPRGKQKNKELWDRVKSIISRNPDLSMQEVAKLADCGVATVYRIKREAP